MSVLKSILHHWNSTSKAYDTLHPETEVGQITDFGKGLLNQLAATTAQSVISALQTGSWFGQLLKLVLNASGVKYSIDTKGYVCLGSFFGGLIIQWGCSSYGYVKFPIAFTAFRLVLLTHQGSSFMIAKATEYADNDGFTLSVTDLNGGVNATQNYDAQYLAIGR